MNDKINGNINTEKLQFEDTQMTEEETKLVENISIDKIDKKYREIDFSLFSNEDKIGSLIYGINKTFMKPVFFKNNSKESFKPMQEPTLKSVNYKTSNIIDISKLNQINKEKVLYGVEQFTKSSGPFIFKESDKESFNIKTMTNSSSNI